MGLAPFYNIDSKPYLISFFVFALLETLLCSGITYGWAIIVIVFNEKQFYMELCDISESNKFQTNFTDTNVTDNAIRKGHTLTHGCLQQQQRLSLILTISLFSLCGVLFPAGMSTDKFGPRTVRVVGGIFYVLASAGLGFVIKGYEDIMFAIFPLICMCGSILFVAVLQVVNTIYRENRSRVLCVLHGALDSSAVMMLIFKISYDSGVPFQVVMLAYASICGALITIGTTILIPPRKVLVKWIQDEKNAFNSVKKLETSKSDSLKSDKSLTFKNDYAIKNSSNLGNNADASIFQTIEETNTIASISFKQIDEEKKIEQLTISSPIDEGVQKESLFKSIFSLIYILELFYFMTMQLKLWYFVGSLADYLYRISDYNQSVVSHYIDLFGYIQFAGLLVNAVGGAIFNRSKVTEGEDRILSPEEIRLHSLKECVFAFLVTNFICLVLCVFSLMEDVRFQIPSYICYVVVRGFLYGNHGAFIGCTFPASQFGRLYGLGYFIGGAFGLLQYALYTMTSSWFNGNPFWTNIILLVLVALGNIHPFYLWWYIRKQSKKIEKTIQRREGKKYVNADTKSEKL